MTEYSHQAVGDVMARVMDNAIRRYMSEFGWYGTWDEGFQGSNWDRLLPGKFGSNGTVQLRQNVTAMSSYTAQPPPGATFLGDETEGSVLFHKYEVDPDAIYRPWVERVNEAFQGWRTLPDPADFDGPIDNLERAVDELTPEAQDSGSYTFVNVDVTAAIDLMARWVSPQGESNSSELPYAFDRSYGVGRIAGVMTNQAQVAAGLGFTVAGEKQLWTKARHDIMAIGTAAADALDVSGGGGGGSIDLGVVKAFIDLVGVFVPAQYKVLTSAASAGLGFLETILPKPTVEAKEVTIDGFTADEMLSSTEKAIQDLDTSIWAEEHQLMSKLDSLREILSSRAPSDFHLHPGAGMDSDFSGAVTDISIDSSMVRDIGVTQIPTIAAAFLRGAEDASAQTGRGIWTRDGIGYGSTGPHYKWSRVIDEFDAITTGSARELVEAGKMLAVGAGWIENSDVEAALEAQGLEDDLERGETEWDYTYRPPQEGP